MRSLDLNGKRVATLVLLSAGVGSIFSSSTVLGADDSQAFAFEKPNGPTGYFANLGWRSSAGVANALNEAGQILQKNPNAKIEFLVHGKDMRLLIDGATRRKPRIVALSQQLAAQGARFRVCDHALSFKGVTLKDYQQQLFRWLM